MTLQPLGNVQARHDAYIKACVDWNNQKSNGLGESCLLGELSRIDLLQRQPKAMINFTETGFTKLRAPEHLVQKLKKFFDDNKENQTRERWSTADIHTNHWEAPSSFLAIENNDFAGGGFALQQQVVNEIRAIIEEWTGQRQIQTSVYGIRIYKNGSMLAPHVDRNPLISSAIICVDNDLDEPWPLEVIGHDGLAHNVTQVPGDLVLYESHSIIHGRQFPLKGRYMANVFVHFEPIGPLNEPIDFSLQLPPYILPGTYEAADFLAENPRNYLAKLLGTSSNDTYAHSLAAENELEELIALLDKEEGWVLDRDENGWTPLAEAIRNGHTEVVGLLLSRGADPHLLLGKDGTDGSLMYMAKEELGDEHPVVQLLTERGAREILPLESDDEEL